MGARAVMLAELGTYVRRLQRLQGPNRLGEHSNQYEGALIWPACCSPTSTPRPLTPHLLTSSTLCAVRADVSKNISPCSRANASPSSVVTARRCCAFV